MTTVFFRADLFHAPGLQASETAAIERIDDALIAVEGGTITAVLRPDDPSRARGGPFADPAPLRHFNLALKFVGAVVGTDGWRGKVNCRPAKEQDHQQRQGGAALLEAAQSPGQQDDL